MARATFVDNVWHAADELYLLRMRPHGSRWVPARMGRAFRHAASWLIPKAVEGYDPQDFVELAPREREELGQEIERFLAVARAVPHGAPATREQVENALPHFRRIIELASQAELAEWRNAVDQFLSQAEEWAREQDWGVKRDTKELSEEFLGTYEVPRLLIHTLENQRYFLEPVARRVAGARGRVDLCLIPSYDSAAIVRTAKGWQLLSDKGAGRLRPWSRKTFLRILAQLARAA
jgi:hypothetical protein